MERLTLSLNGIFSSFLIGFIILSFVTSSYTKNTWFFYVAFAISIGTILCTVYKNKHFLIKYIRPLFFLGNVLMLLLVMLVLLSALTSQGSLGGITFVQGAAVTLAFITPLMNTALFVSLFQKSKSVTRPTV
ncbi:hypothetical protein [Kangiella marina]|uniref:hypothetical protein n=1 Tax=Kangiella marina TaxID=1079178 RepID=UPI0031E5C5CC